MYNRGTDVPFNSCSFYKEHLSSETNRFGWFTWPKEKKGHVLAFFDINQSKTNNGREIFTLFAAVCTVLKWGTKILGNDHDDGDDVNDDDDDDVDDVDDDDDDVDDVDDVGDDDDADDVNDDVDDDNTHVDGDGVNDDDDDDDVDDVHDDDDDDVDNPQYLRSLSVLRFGAFSNFLRTLEGSFELSGSPFLQSLSLRSFLSASRISSLRQRQINGFVNEFKKATVSLQL